MIKKQERFSRVPMES